MISWGNNKVFEIIVVVIIGLFIFGFILSKFDHLKATKKTKSLSYRPSTSTDTRSRKQKELDRQESFEHAGELSKKLGTRSSIVEDQTSPIFENRLIYGDHYNYMIVYEDNDGFESERYINITDIYSQSKRWYINADCQLRGDERTFRADRIKELTNLKTGEYLSNQTAIRAYMRDLAKEF